MFNPFEGKLIADLYVKYRPIYSKEIVEKVVEYVKREKNGEKPLWMIDVGCGSGQSSEIFKNHFDKITGFDVSENQIAQARRIENSQVEYLVSPAELLPLDDKSIDVICCGSAAHWFDLPKFFSECRRVLKEDGTLVLFGYDLPYIDPKGDIPSTQERHALHEEARKLLEELFRQLNHSERALEAMRRYAKIFEMVPSMEKNRDDSLSIVLDGSLEDLKHYFESTSCYRGYLHRNPPGRDKLQQFVDDVKKLYGLIDTEDYEIPLVISWNVYILFFRHLF